MTCFDLTWWARRRRLRACRHTWDDKSAVFGQTIIQEPAPACNKGHTHQGESAVLALHRHTRTLDD